MMSWHMWLLFAPACFVINMLPGPNNMMAMSNGTRFGTARASMAGVGRLIGFAILIGLTIIGLGAVLAASETVFVVLKYVGAAYLVYLGIRLWRIPQEDVNEDISPSDGHFLTLARREFLVAISNPKAILTFTALFPQLLDRTHSTELQLSAMGLTFLAGEFVSIATFAAAGHGASFFFSTARGRQLLNRGSGSLLVAAGILLAFTKRA